MISKIKTRFNKKLNEYLLNKLYIKTSKEELIIKDTKYNFSILLENIFLIASIL